MPQWLQDEQRRLEWLTMTQRAEMRRDTVAPGWWARCEEGQK